MVTKTKKAKEEITIKATDSSQRVVIGVIRVAKVENAATLFELMKKFQSAKRFMRERIFEGLTRKQSEALAKPKFLNNSRYMRDAFLEAEASIQSQKELLPTYVQQYEKKIKKLQKGIIGLKNLKTECYEQKVQYKESKIKKLQKKMNYYQYHIENGTVPKVIDGTKKLFSLYNKGKATLQEWREARSNAIYSRGEKSKGGNENMKLSYLNGNMFEIRILNPLANKKNTRLEFMVEFPEKFVQTVCQYLSTGEAYSIRVQRKNGKILVHLAFEHELKTNFSFKNGIAAFDLNPDNIAATIVYKNGNFRASKVFHMCNINTVSADKRDWMIQDTVIKAIQWVKSFDIDALVIEDLKFIQSHASKEFNRISSNFSYRSMTNTIISTCQKEAVALLQVNAHYSSLIGKIKYQQMYGLSVHQSAAFVLARRGLGLKEKIPSSLMTVLFAKEAKKGQKLDGLFTAWKKVKRWHDQVVTQLKKIKLKKRPIKDWQLQQLIAFSQSFDSK